MVTKRVGRSLWSGLNERQTMILLWLSAAWIAAVVGVIAWLVATNLSPRVWQPIASIAVVGVTTALFTLLTILKEVRVNDAFVATVVMDKVTRRMPIVLPSEDNFSQVMKWSRLQTVTNAVKVGPDQHLLPLEEAEAPRFYADAIQFRIADAIRDYYTDAWPMQWVVASGGGAGIPQIVGFRFLPNAPAGERYRWSDIRDALRQNQFSENPQDAALGDLRAGAVLPPGCKLLVRPTGLSGPWEPHSALVLEKEGFFRVSFAVRPSTVSEGPMGLLTPKFLGMAPDEAGKLRAQTFIVEYEAVFGKYRAGHPDAEHYQRWAAELFRIVRLAVGDDK